MDCKKRGPLDCGFERSLSLRGEGPRNKGRERGAGSRPEVAQDQQSRKIFLSQERTILRATEVTHPRLSEAQTRLFYFR